MVLDWLRHFDVRSQADDLASFYSDTRRSLFRNELVPASDTTGFENVSGGTAFIYEEATGLMNGTLTFNGGAKIDLQLRIKLASDYHIPPQEIVAVNERYTLSPAAYFTGFALSQATGSLYLSNLGWPGETTSFMSRYDLSNNQIRQVFFENKDDADMHIELTDDGVVNLGGRDIQRFDYDLNAPVEQATINGLEFGYGTTSQDNIAYVFGGYINGINQGGQLGTLAPGEEQVNVLGTLPSVSRNTDGAIIGQNLYTFGGIPDEIPGVTASRSLFRYDFRNGDIVEFDMPVLLRRARASALENWIYVAGIEPIDTDEDGTFDDTRNFLGAYHVNDKIWREIELSAPELRDKDISNIHASRDKLYLVCWKNTIEEAERRLHIYEVVLD